jgi:proline-specific peptidase
MQRAAADGTVGACNVHGGKNEMFVTVNGARLFLDVEGASLVPEGPVMRTKPTLVLLHGGPGFDHSVLRPAFSQLSDIAQIVYFDQRGSGRSVESDPNTWTLAQWGDDVKGLCDALGIEKPIVLGVSYGGFVAQSYAVRHPNHTAGLILSNTAAHMDFETVYSAFERFGGVEAGRIARAYWEDPSVENWNRYAAICLPLYNSRPPHDVDWKKRAVVQTEVGTSFNGPYNEHGRMDFRQSLKAIKCPALVLGGGRDPITPMSFSETLVACLAPSQVQFERFEECGHPVHVDDPSRAFAVIRSFLASTSLRMY